MDVNLSFAWLMLLMLGIFHGLNPGMGWLFAVGLGLQEQQRSAVWRALLPLALGHALAVGAAVLAALLVGRAVPTDVLKWIVAGSLFVFGVYRLVRHGHPRYGGMQMRPRDLTVWSFLMATAHGAGLMVLPFVFDPVGRASSHASASQAAQDAGSHLAGGFHHAGAHAAADAAPQVVHAAGRHVQPADLAHGADLMQAADVAQAADSVFAGAGGHASHAAGLLASLPQEPLTGLLVTLVHTLGYLLVMGALAVIVYEKLGLRLLRTAWINLDLIWAGVLILTALLTPFV